ncbi:putative DNA binding domain-containing protein [Pelagibacterium sp. 26DY04]|uniref:ATP-binding protein n=1 Tax=Pelagibacterium sp. 26DY04 TaxID=2967130 RepID=UPI002814B7C6|nr:ATP-binding protein [Pelagibacterium sp. 26DY04]WMT86688.1 putative DNA binding domain-containing protein [Pelagibacterium sp. 26DY04]
MNPANPQRLIDLIDDLIRKGEVSWVEFKLNNADPEMIGPRIAAISNAARLAGQQTGFMLWGISDAPAKVVGTTFNPESDCVGNQVLSFWLARQLVPSIAFQFHRVRHPDGEVVVLEIPAATSAPVAFKNVAYLRIGSATPKLTDYPERYQSLLSALRPYAWEHGIALQYVTSDDVFNLLDYAQYFRLTKQPLPDNRMGILDRLKADQLIAEDVGGRWNITNLGAILFAVDLTQFSQSLARKGVRFIGYGGTNKATPVSHRQDGKRGYAAGFEGLISYINGLLPRNEHIGQALRVEHPLFPELAIRELVANALIHQDLTITGAGPQIEMFSDRIEITNPGAPLVMPERMIDLPPRSRNEAMASLMRRMGLCEEQGSGLDKVIAEAEIFQLPAPLFRASDDSLQVVLYGPRTFAQMTPDERVRACYQHAVLKFISGERMKNASLCDRFGIAKQNAAQASQVINLAIQQGLIKPADLEHPRSGYVPYWA